MAGQDTSISSVFKQQVEMRAAQAGKSVRAAAHTVDAVADDLRSDATTAPFADLAARGARSIDRIGVYLEESEFETLLTDAEEYTREYPLVVGAAALVIGIATSRFVKAAAARRAVDRAPARKPVRQRRPRAKKVANGG